MISNPPLRVKGHRLETIAARGGIMASCSCEAAYYRPPTGNAARQTFAEWEKPAMRAAHQKHLQEVLDNPDGIV